MKFVLPIPVPVDGNGTPYPFTRLHLFDAGTTTPKTAWVDAAHTATHSHPILSDADGRFPEIWLDDAPAAARLGRTDGTLIWSADPVGGGVEYPAHLDGLRAWPVLSGAVYVHGHDLPGDGGGGWFVYDPASTAADDDGILVKPDAVAGTSPGRWRRSFEGPVYAAWYGCRPRSLTSSEGVVNSAALNRALAASRHVILPQGEIPLAGGHRINKTVLEGSGTSVTMLVHTGGHQYCLMLETLDTLKNRDCPRGWGIRDFSVIKKAGVTGGHTGICVTGAMFTVNQRIRVSDYAHPADISIHFLNGVPDFGLPPDFGDPKEFLYSEYTIFEDCVTANTVRGVLFETREANGSFHGCRVVRHVHCEMPWDTSLESVGIEVRRNPGQEGNATATLYNGEIDLSVYLSSTNSRNTGGEALRCGLLVSARLQESKISVRGEGVGGDIARWSAGRTFTIAAGKQAMVIPPLGTATGLMYSATQSGQTSTIEPDWPLVPGGQVTDGTITWTAIPGVWLMYLEDDANLRDNRVALAGVASSTRYFLEKLPFSITEPSGFNPKDPAAPVNEWNIYGSWSIGVRPTEALHQATVSAPYGRDGLLIDMGGHNTTAPLTLRNGELTVIDGQPHMRVRYYEGASNLETPETRRLIPTLDSDANWSGTPRFINGMQLGMWHELRHVDIAASPWLWNTEVKRGDIRFRLNPAAGGNIGWVVVTSGHMVQFAWATGETVAIGDLRYNGTKAYKATTDGTTGTTPPTHTSGTASDGGVTWEHLGTRAVYKNWGAIEA